MNENLVKLIAKAREAVDRGDMLVGQVSDFRGDLDMYARLMEIPIGTFNGRVLLKLKKPKIAINREGEEVRIVSMYDGVYYSQGGQMYREKDLAWVKDKELP